MSKLIVCLVFLSFAKLSFSQQENIYNKWVIVSQSDCNDSSQSLSDNSLWSIEFKNNLTAEICSKSTDTKFIQNFKINSNHIKLDYRDLIINDLRNDSLWLEEIMGDKCMRYLMISRKIVESIQKHKVIISNSDTLYLPEFGNTPILDNYTNYASYFHNNVSMQKLNLQEELKVTFIFIVTKDGLIKDPNVFTNQEKYKKTLLRIIDNTNKDWTPMYIDDKSVDSLVRLKFSYLSQ